MASKACLSVVKLAAGIPELAVRVTWAEDLTEKMATAIVTNIKLFTKRPLKIPGLLIIALKKLFIIMA